jgi:hypothetical protein
MGKQIQICTTDSDNLLFEDYLRSTFTCVFFQSSAPTIDQVQITSFSEARSPFGAQIFIWNNQFKWTPEFGQTTAKDKFYLSDISKAPLIEFSKTVWTPNSSHGRIYWAKYFTAGPIEYDVNEFESFYKSVTKWFIKNAKGKIKSAGINIYYLKEAWERQTQNQKNGS